MAGADRESRDDEFWQRVARHAALKMAIDAHAARSTSVSAIIGMADEFMAKALQPLVDCGALLNGGGGVWIANDYELIEQLLLEEQPTDEESAVNKRTDLRWIAQYDGILASYDR